MNQKQTITVIGAGAIGSGVAWHLCTLGHEVILVDDSLNKAFTISKKPLSGTDASLGVLMGYVYRRFNGRNWRLRERSMNLWPKWIEKLSSEKYPISIKSPLVQLASSEKEMEYMQKLIAKRSHLGIELLTPDSKKEAYSSWHPMKYGGLISHRDGRINPHDLRDCLIRALQEKKATFIDSKVEFIERNKSNTKWCVHIAKGDMFNTNTVVICAANGSAKLLEQLGYSRPLTKVIGQVLDLEIQNDENNLANWPAVLVNQGINLIPQGANRLLLGATLEFGDMPREEELDHIKNLKGNAPKWLKNSKVINQWYGIRARPINRSAPLLEKLEEGLILATGHYRNGILLTPVTAEWVGEIIS